MQSQPTGTILAQDSSNPSTIEHGPAAAQVQAASKVQAAAQVQAGQQALPELEQEVAGLIVDALNLEIAASEIDPEAPLFGEGLGLDSIDILEVALVVSKRYGFQLRSADSNNTRIFQSLRSLCQHIAQNRLT